jgi:gamma-glutamylcyclotransferase (GGCT)/AIG2-like uncharacterized protein YtfP
MQHKKRLTRNQNIEIYRMWNMKWFVIAVITGDTGIVTEGLKSTWKQHQHSIQHILYKKSSYTRDIAHNKEGATI